MRIKFIIPFPFDDEGIANRAAQIPKELLGPDTVVECVPVRNSATFVTDYYESMLFDVYIAEAAFRAEEGYDAVIMDTVSDSGLYAIRSRLNILAIGPGLISYAVAIMLGKRFSIVTMWDRWRLLLYEKNLDTYHLWEKCASIRAVNIPPDVESLFAGKEEESFEKLTAEARRAIDEDGADVILLGSTTMHQAGDYMAANLPCPVINPGPVGSRSPRRWSPSG